MFMAYGGIEQRRARRQPIQWNASITLDDGLAQIC
jgi:hypothetical protein